MRILIMVLLWSLSACDDGSTAAEAFVQQGRSLVEAGDIDGFRATLDSNVLEGHPEFENEYLDIGQQAYAYEVERITDDLRSSEDEASIKLKVAMDAFSRAERSLPNSEAPLHDLEAAALEIVQPIPASDIQANIVGYELLANIDPANREYRDRLLKYRAESKAAAKAAAETLEIANQRDVNAILGSYRKVADDFTGEDKYYRPISPRFVNSRSAIFAYIVKSKYDNYSLRYQIQYTASDWLFIDRVEYKADNQSGSFAVSRFPRDHARGEIWEWTNARVDERAERNLRQIGSAKSATLRLTGSTYYKDVPVGPKDRAALLRVLDDYDRLQEIG